MFDLKDLSETPFGVLLLSPDSDDDYYGEDDPHIYEKPVSVKLNTETIDCIGYILNKYKDKYENRFNRKLYSSNILRVANKLGMELLIKKDSEPNFFKIYDDLYWFRETVLYNLYEKTQNETILDIIDVLRSEMDKSLIIIDSKDFWGKRLIKKTFIPYPRWRDITGLWASKIHIPVSLMYSISIIVGLNIERPLKTYKNLINEFCNIISRNYGLLRSIIYSFEDIFTSYRDYFLKSINNKPSLSDEIKSILLDALTRNSDQTHTKY